MSNLADYQKRMDDFLERENYDPKYWTPHEILARLIEEVGEVARIINHQYGPKPPKPGEEHDLLEHELGDIMFALICLANREQISLDDAVNHALNKAQTRDLDRFPRKV